MKNKNSIYKPADDYERDLLKAIESTSKFKRPKNHKQMMIDAKKTAANTSLKNKSINIRISEKDLVKLKESSVSTGIPYQTIINMIIRKYNKGGVRI